MGGWAGKGGGWRAKGASTGGGGPATELAAGCVALGSVDFTAAPIDCDVISCVELDCSGGVSGVNVSASAGLTIVAGGLTVTAGGLTVTAGGITVAAGQVLVPDGTAAAPSIAFSGATSSGIYRSGSAAPAFSNGGTLRGYFSSSLNISAPAELSIGQDAILSKVTAPSAPGANLGRLFLRDNGSGKMQLAAIFPTGAIQAIATEP
jgi:hypothetical protein